MNSQKVVAFLKAHWPAIAAFAGAFWLKFGTTISAYVQAHPKWSGAYALAAFVAAYYTKSPRQTP